MTATTRVRRTSTADTPMQEKLRVLAPMPVGAVFIERPGMTEEEIRGHFRLMKQLGYNCLKQLCCCPGTPRARVMHWALDEGIIPWWYGEAGFEAITPELLGTLGIDPKTPVRSIREDERFRAHQETLMRARIDAEEARESEPADESPRKHFRFDIDLAPGTESHFVAWLRTQYETPERLAHAWNMGQSMIDRPAQPWRSWDDVEHTVVDLLGTKEYRRRRDVIRFKADCYLTLLRGVMTRQAARDPHAPQRAGGEMGLFLPFGARATDMAGIARTMVEFGSFYPSIHLAWHFEETEFSHVPEVYLQASLAADWFRDGWSATWESTGGPQQLSGGPGLIPEARPHIAGYTVDEHTMEQLMFSYLAAGFRGFGFWCWNTRGVGWEAGEYALLDRNDKPCARTRRAGAIGRTAEAYRDELWQAQKQPVAGVLVSFENEAMWAAVSRAGRDRHKCMGVQARIGLTRALSRCNVPWEHVTPHELRGGLASRYAVVCLPAQIVLEDDIIAHLEEYVRTGGRVVMDVPSAWYDTYGRLLPTAEGSAFERLFGVEIHDYQYAGRVRWGLRGTALDGFVLNMSPTRARVAASYDNGQPAITEHALGSGTAVVLGYEASLLSFRHPHSMWEQAAVRDVLGDCALPFTCEQCMVYALAAPTADHYFFVNVGRQVTATLDVDGVEYGRVHDPVSDEDVSLREVEVPGWGGRWVRCEKRAAGHS